MSRDFLLGVIVSAWHLHVGHGEDTYAEEILLNAASAETMRRLARKEDYQFKRGFWAELKRRQKRNQ